MVYLASALILAMMVAFPLAWYYNRWECWFGHWRYNPKRIFKNTRNFPVPRETHAFIHVCPAKFAELCSDVESIKSKLGERPHQLSNQVDALGNPDRVVLSDSLMHVQCTPVDLQLTEEQMNRISAALADKNGKLLDLLKQATKLGDSGNFAMRALADPKTGKMEMVSFDVISDH